MLTCKHVARLLSDAHDRPLTLFERMSLSLHLLMCSDCRHCEKQMDVLRTACQRMASGNFKTKKSPSSQ